MPIDLKANPGCCEEAAILPPGLDFYAPCNKRAERLMLSRDRGEPYLMCIECARHNRGRGMIDVGPYKAEATHGAK